MSRIQWPPMPPPPLNSREGRCVVWDIRLRRWVNRCVSVPDLGQSRRCIVLARCPRPAGGYIIQQVLGERQPDGSCVPRLSECDTLDNIPQVPPPIYRPPPPGFGGGSGGSVPGIPAGGLGSGLAGGPSLGMR